MATYIDGIGASENIDTSGEIVSIAGLDISSLELDGYFNFEHESKTPASVIGKILKAKKIFSDADCDDDRQLHFWQKCKTPFLYVMGELFDEYKDSAREVAGMFRYDTDHNNERNIMNFSVEGATIQKVGNTIARSIARKISITSHPCNKVAIAEMVPKENPKKKDNLDNIFKTENFVEIEVVNMNKTESLWDLLKKESLIKKAKALFGKPIKKDMPGGGMAYGASTGLSGTAPSSPGGILTCSEPEMGRSEEMAKAAIDQGKSKEQKIADRSSRNDRGASGKGHPKSDTLNPSVGKRNEILGQSIMGGRVRDPKAPTDGYISSKAIASRQLKRLKNEPKPNLPKSENIYKAEESGPKSDAEHAANVAHHEGKMTAAKKDMMSSKRRLSNQPATPTPHEIAGHEAKIKHFENMAANHENAIKGHIDFFKRKIDSLKLKKAYTMGVDGGHSEEMTKSRTTPGSANRLLGRTTSGKDVHSHAMVGNTGFTAEEHGQAANLHLKAAKENPRLAEHHNNKAKLHNAASVRIKDAHFKRQKEMGGTNTNPPVSGSKSNKKFHPELSGKLQYKKSETLAPGEESDAKDSQQKAARARREKEAYPNAEKRHFDTHKVNRSSSNTSSQSQQRRQIPNQQVKSSKPAVGQSDNNMLHDKLLAPRQTLHKAGPGGGAGGGGSGSFGGSINVGYSQSTAPVPAAPKRPKLGTLNRNEKNLKKALEAGSSLASPDRLVGGAVLGKESLEKDSKDPNWMPKDKKIAHLQRQIDAGTYKPDSKKIAGKMLEHKDKPLKKLEVLQKPYTSDAQRRWAHTAAGTKALGGKSHVHEWDEATKGKKLPEHVKKSEAFQRAEAEYANWSQKSEFENFMKSRMPHLTKGEIVAIGQALLLNKSMKLEKSLDFLSKPIKKQK